MSLPLDDLLKRLERLEMEHTRLHANIKLLREEAAKWQSENSSEDALEELAPHLEPVIELEEKPITKAHVYEPVLEEENTAPTGQPKSKFEVPLPLSRKSEIKADTDRSLEKYLGENISSKVGIAVLILGTGIFAKYAIDHNWITPFLRIFLGYLLGAAVYFTALKLRDRYTNLSAILMAGSLCIAYLISYFAFSLYNFYPRWLAFTLLLVFTGHTIQMSLKYKLESMAVIALVGAYAVPFLLSNNSGKVEYLFTYIAVINLGSLFLTLRKNWQILWNSGFAFTWIIYLSWALFERRSTTVDQFISIGFLVFFSGIFLTGLVQFARTGILEQKRYYVLQLGFVSFCLYVIGNFVLVGDEHFYQRCLYALFCTLSYLILYLYLKKNQSSQVLFTDLLLAISIIYATGFIPIALDGEWKTAMWGVEALLLAYIGIKHENGLLRRGSLLIGILALISTGIETSSFHSSNSRRIENTPFLNPAFLLNLFGCALLYLNTIVQAKKNRELVENELSTRGLSFLSLTIGFYLTFLIDLSYAIQSMSDANNWNPSWYMSVICLVNWTFTVGYVALAKYLTDLNGKNEKADNFMAGTTALLSVFFLFLVVGSQYTALVNQYGQIDTADLLMLNLISCPPLLLLWFIGSRYKSNFEKLSPNFFAIASRVYVLIFLSMELLIFFKLGFIEKQQKVAMSILWGAYALYQIVDGVRNKRQEFRWIGLLLLAITITKLFFYDLARLSTISKTISLICLGIFLLLVSYFYNKYKHLLDNDNTEENVEETNE